MEDGWNSSYIYGFDNKSNWGERYFFSYYSEYGPRSTTSVAFELTLCSLVFVVSIVANLGIALCIIRFPEMRTVTNVFVFNLAAADLLLAMTIPAVAYTRAIGDWKLGDIACKLVPYFQLVSGIVLLWTLAIISIDRHRCIVIPPYRSSITIRKAYLLSALIWISSSALLLPFAFWFREQQDLTGERTVCTLVFPKSPTVNFAMCFALPVVVFACLLPMVVLVYHYQMIFKKIISTKNTWAASCVMVSNVSSKTCERNHNRRESEVSLADFFVPWPRKFSAASQGTAGDRHGSWSHHEELRINKHIKVVRVLFLNVILVLLMWLPITIVMLLIYVDGRRPNEDMGYFLSSEHFVVALIVAYLNTLVNPLLYGVLSDGFRACFKKMWCARGDDERTSFVKDNVTPSSARLQQDSGSKRKSYVISLSEHQINV